MVISHIIYIGKLECGDFKDLVNFKKGGDIDIERLWLRLQMWVCLYVYVPRKS